MFVWPDVLANLKAQIDRRRGRQLGQGRTLVFSMLTDGFSPWLVENGITELALRLVLDGTAFRIRVLTKNAEVGSPYWIKLFSRYPGRFVVGLSIGTADDRWARAVEVGTPPPSARFKAVRSLQDAGIPTYGMLCPIFPDVLSGDGVEQLVDRVRPDLVEHVWAEPYNDRDNWEKVRRGYPPGSFGYQWFTDVYENNRTDLWSRYATELYTRLRKKAKKEGWSSKLRYLLYEDQIQAADAPTLRGLRGVLLQSKPGPDGMSRNSCVAAIQAPARRGRGS